MLFNHSMHWGGFSKYCIAPEGGGGVKKKTVVTALHSEKFAEFQRQALVECPAFLGYRGCRGFH